MCKKNRRTLHDHSHYMECDYTPMHKMPHRHAMRNCGLPEQWSHAPPQEGAREMNYDLCEHFKIHFF